MTRVAIYVRYSSENQREASIEDQVEVCRRYADRQGWSVVEIYDDRAASGASRFRAGLARMSSDAEAHKFDVLVCESIDRLGRKLADVADLFDRLSFLRIQVHATSIGLLTPMHVGIMGTMAQMTLADLREKTRRGHSAEHARDASRAAWPTATRSCRQHRAAAMPGSVGSRRPRPVWFGASSPNSAPANRPARSPAI
jgi:DNA invertase Pin-like site-specific DNA recombinase